MLEVERLVCTKPNYHKDCRWVHAKIRYPDTRYLLLKQVIEREVQKTKIAYRIIHEKFGVLATIKMGHDNKLFIQEDLKALKEFALY